MSAAGTAEGREVVARVEQPALLQGWPGILVLSGSLCFSLELLNSKSLTE